MENKNIKSVDTGLLALNCGFISGGVFTNGNYDFLNLEPLDKLICACVESGMSVQKIAEELNRRSISFTNKQIEQRIHIYQEMFESYCKSQLYFATQKVHHPYRTR